MAVNQTLASAHEALVPARQTGRRPTRPISQRERGISRGSQCAPRRRDRAAPPPRARRRARRALPPGGEIPQDFEFASETGPVRLSDLFGDKNTLMIYSMMFGPQRKAPCPFCTSFLTSWNGTAINLRERVAIAVTARSPIERLKEYKKQRGFANLPFSPTPPATTPAPTSTPKTQTSPASPSLPGTTEPSVTSTRAR